MERTGVQVETGSSQGARSSSSGLLQRQCACGTHTMGGGQCAECQKKNKMAVGGRPLQAKLAISEPGDAYEQEADRVAEQVMRMSSADASRKQNGSKAQPLVQRRASQGATGLAEAPQIVHDVLNSPGQPLDLATRAFFEPRFGQDLSGVRVHTDSRAGQSARAVKAHAYTVGSNVVFESGKYAPYTRGGQKLLTHELAHVIQQRAISPAGSTASTPMASLDAEHDAGKTAQQVFYGRPAILLPPMPLQLARYARKEDVQALKDDELTSEHKALQAWVIGHNAADPIYGENLNYLQQLEAEVSRRNPARQAAAKRQAVAAKSTRSIATGGLLFAPVFAFGPAQSAFLIEFGYGLWDGVMEQPAERKARIETRFRDLQAPFGHLQEKWDFTKGYLKGIASGVWKEIEGIWELLTLLPKLQWEMNMWLVKQAANFPGFSSLSVKGEALYLDLQNLTSKALEEMKSFFANPLEAMKKLSDMLESLLAAGLAKAYQLGLQSVDKALSIAEKPFRELGEGIGEIVGFVLFQVVMLVATEAIGNIIAKGSGLIARVGRAVIEGSAEVAGAVRAFVSELVAVVRRLAGSVLKAFEGTLEALINLFRRVASFFDEVAEAIGPRAVLETGGAPAPNILMSVEAKGASVVAKPTRTTMTTVEKLRTPKVHPSNLPKSPAIQYRDNLLKRYPKLRNAELKPIKRSLGEPGLWEESMYTGSGKQSWSAKLRNGADIQLDDIDASGIVVDTKMRGINVGREIPPARVPDVVELIAGPKAGRVYEAFPESEQTKLLKQLRFCKENGLNGVRWETNSSDLEIAVKRYAEKFLTKDEQKLFTIKLVER